MLTQDDLTNLLIRADGTIRNCLTRMNSTPHLIQLVVDAEGRLVGMVTDGDVRRALVAGRDLDDPVTTCMRRDPITVRSDREAMAILPTLTGRRRCIPVLDEAGRPVRVVSDAPEMTGLDTAVVMAGGFGRRQGARTAVTPKPLLPIAGRPVLWHIVRQLEDHGLKRIFLTIHHLGDQIREFVRKSDFRARIEFIEEPRPLGTAGGLGLLPAKLAGPLLVMNADIVTRADFAAMFAHHRLHQNELTIGATRYDLEVPYGVLKIADDGRVTEIQEKPHFRNVVSAGIYLIEVGLLSGLTGEAAADMPDLIRAAMTTGRRVGAFPIHEYWLDLARPSDLAQAEEDSLSWLRERNVS